MSAPARSFNEHLKATLVLGLPLVGAQVTQMLINVTDTVMLGWLGTRELAAGTLAFQSFFILMIFGLGFGAAMIPLIANALGRDDERAVRRASRMGIWVLLALGLVFQIPLYFTEAVLVAFGQDAELAALAQTYMRIAQWSMLPAFVIVALRSFLTGLEKAQAVLWLTVVMAILNGLLNYALIFGNWGFPRLGIEGAAVATVAVNVAGALATVAYVVWDAEAKRYELFKNFWRPEWPAMRAIVGLGVPISLGIFAEVGMFLTCSLMVGWIGVVELAAHSVALQLASIAFMVPLGLAQAASVRVGNAAGRDDRLAVGRAGHAVMAMALGFVLVAGLLFALLPGPLIRLWLDADNPDLAEIIRIGIPLLYMAAAFQIFDTLQVTASGALRGLQDTQVPMVIMALSYWIVGLGSAYVAAFVLDFGAVGVWAGLVIGLATASVALTWRFEARERLGLLPS
ncbi:MAG: MATE family efflux transporter [Pseudomonadota bacterium]